MIRQSLHFLCRVSQREALFDGWRSYPANQRNGPSTFPAKMLDPVVEMALQGALMRSVSKNSTNHPGRYEEARLAHSIDGRGNYIEICSRAVLREGYEGDTQRHLL